MAAGEAVVTMLSAVLNAEEVESLADPCREKLEAFLVAASKTSEALTEENAQLKARCERSSFQLEAALAEHRRELNSAEEQCDKFKKQVAELSEKLGTCQAELYTSKTAVSAARADLELTKKNLDRVTKEKLDLVEVLNAKSDEINRLSESVRTLTEEVNSGAQELRNRTSKLEELQVKEVSSQHLERRLRHEIELGAQQSAELSEELLRARQELAELRRGKTGATLDLQAQLDDQKEAARVLQSQVDTWKNSCMERDQRLEALASRLREQQQSYAALEEHFDQELMAQTKLTELYKESSESGQAKAQELLSTLADMQNVLLQTKAEAEEAEKALAQANGDHQKVLADKEAALQELKEQLDIANSLLTSKVGDPEVLFPVASATSRALASGKSMTELIGDYFRQQQELALVCRERDSLRAQLEELSKEVQEKVPIVSRHMQEYERALLSIGTLREQLTTSMVETEQASRERDDAKRLLGHVQRDSQRWQQKAQDLSKQVCTLLMEVEDARANYAARSRSGQEGEISSTEQEQPVNAATVISKHLVTFRSVEELQEKNLELLAVVRELSDKQEQEEKMATEERKSELQSKLESALEQLQELEQERNRQVSLVASLAQQRDMYRMMLAQKDVVLPPGQETSSFQPTVTSTPATAPRPLAGSPDFPRGKLLSPEAALKELQHEFDVYKKEMGENHKMVTEQLESLREEALQLRVSCSQKSAELDFTKERLSVAQSNLDNFMKEAAALRERNLTLGNSLVQHQQTMATLRQELMESQEKAARAEVSLDSVRAERDLLKAIEARRQAERETLQQEQGTQARILANLEVVQLNLSRMDQERRGMEQSKVQKLELQVSSLTQQLAQQAEKQASLASLWEKQLSDAAARADAEAQKARKTQDELVDSYAQLHEARSELVELKSKTVAGPGDSAEVSSLRSLLTKSQDQVKDAQAQLEVAKKHAESLQTLAGNAEARLAEQDSLGKQFREAMEKALKDVGNDKKSLEEKVTLLEAQNHELANEKAKLLEEGKTKLEELQQQLTAAQKELVEVRTQAENTARRDAEQLLDQDVQASLVEQAQEKYERELLLHAADIEALSATRAEMSKLQLQVSQLEGAAKSAEQALKEAQESWLEREKLLHQEKDAMQLRTEELSQQNNVVHQQLELLSSQLSALQQNTWTEPSAEEQSKSSEQLMEVVRFLRKEKELFARRASIAEAESARLSVQLKHKEGLVKQLQKDLSAEHQKTLARATSDTQHAELLRKVEMVSILSESNRVLRGEKEELSDSCKQLQSKLSQLENRLGPLEEELRAKGSQAEVLQGDVGFLRGEVQRWQQRANQLLEQSNRTDPEAFKRLAEENTNLKQANRTISEELQSTKVQLGRATEEVSELTGRLARGEEETKRLRVELSQLAQLRKELLTARAEMERQKGELTKMATEAEALTADKDDKLKNLVQVKKIARRYRSQYEDLKVEKESLESKTKELETKLADLQKAQAAQAQALAQAQAQAQSQAQVEAAQKELEARSAELAEQLEQSKSEVTRLVAEKDQANAATSKAKALILQARKRISDLNTKMEELVKENESLKQSLEAANRRVTTMEQSRQESTLRESSIRSQYEGRFQRQDRELREARDALDRAQRQADDLVQKLAQQQQQQKQAKPTMVTAPVERSSGLGVAEPVTANVRPLTPPSTAGIRVTPSASLAGRLPPTASIRPMAQSRLATVAPTAPVPAASTVEETAPLSAAVAPVQPEVQPSVQSTPATVVVAPTPVPDVTAALVSEASPQGATESVRETESDSATEAAVPTSTVIVVPVITVTAAPQTVPESSDGVSQTKNAADEEASAMASASTPVTLKRQRDYDQEPSSSDAQTVPKKMRASASPTEAAKRPAPPSSSDAAVPSVDIPEEGVSSSLGGSVSEEVAVASPADVIVAESDDEAIEEEEVPQKTAEVSQDLEKEESGMEDEGSEYEDEEMNMGYTRLTVEPEESMPVEELDQDIAEAPEEGCSVLESTMDEPGEASELEVIEIGDDVGEDNEMEEPATEEEEVVPSFEPQQQMVEEQEVAGVGAVPLGSPSVVPSRVPLQRPSLLPRSRSERLPSSQSAGFEEGDDSIVPSTPTLFVPRRGDGFAEAVSSPHVPHGGFVFGSAPETSSAAETPGLSQLASQEAVGVDDTRMDLSHFEEGSGRSVPSTPLQISPPESRDASLFQADNATVEVTEPADETAEESQHQEELDLSLGERSVPGTVVLEAVEADEGLPSNVDPLVEEPPDQQLEEVAPKDEAAQSGVIITPVPSLESVSEEKEEEEIEGATSAVEQEPSAGTSSAGESPAAVVSEAQASGTSSSSPSTSSSQAPAQQTQRRRIVWEEPEPSTSSPPIVTAPAAPVVHTLPGTPLLVVPTATGAPPAAASVAPPGAPFSSPVQGASSPLTGMARGAMFPQRGQQRGRRVSLRSRGGPPMWMPGTRGGVRGPGHGGRPPRRRGHQF